MTAIRWIIMLPVAFLAGMLGSLLGGLALAVFGNQMAMDSASAFLGCFALAFIAGLIAPSKRENTTLIFAGLVTVLAVVCLVASITTDIEGFGDQPLFRKILIPVSQIFGGLCAVWRAHRVGYLESGSNVTLQTLVRGNEMSVRETVGVSVMSLVLMVNGFLALVIHVWSIGIAFATIGLGAAILTFVLPVIAEVFWFARIGTTVGFGSTYCLCIMAYVGLFMLGVVGAGLAPAAD